MAEALPQARWRIVSALGITQIVAWGSIYYAFSLLIQPLSLAVGASQTVVVGAFSAALLVTGLASAPVGALIDRIGGRWVMTGGSLLAGILLAVLPLVHTLAQLYLVWAGLGLAMAACLYDPAFAVLTQVFQAQQRKAITALTLFGGFASTVFWPLTQALISAIGWQQALLVLAALNLLVCVPLHGLVLPADRAPRSDQPAPEGNVRPARLALLRDPAFYGLAAAFTGNALVFSAMSVHLLPLLQNNGLSAATAAWVGAMIGPMQVLGRVLEFALLRNQPASRVGVIAIWLLPLSLCLFSVAGSSLALFALFALLYGTGNGVMTIVRGAMPREVYGSKGYGAVNGALATPVLIAKAAGPIAAAVIFATGSIALVLILAGISAAAAAMFTWTTARARAVAQAIA